tara:strand:- start:133 stop:366 length:234 start_codon:yes stop_codon:yes gene_type:complete
MKTKKPQKYGSDEMKTHADYMSKSDLALENEMLKSWIGYMDYKAKYYASQDVQFICKDLDEAINTIKKDLLTKRSSF